MSTAPINPRTAGGKPIEVMPPTRAVRVSPAMIESASAKLIGATGGPAGRASTQRFLASAKQQGIDLTRFWCVDSGRGSGRGSRMLAAALLSPSTGGTGMLFTSEPRNAEESRALGECVEAACGAPEGVKLAQCLLTEEQLATTRVVREHGFIFVGDLLYLKRPWKPVELKTEAGWPQGVTVEPWKLGDDPEVMQALERSYIDTLDCPELCGLRETADVLESHRGAGRWRPELWWIVRYEGEAEGVLLLNEFPDQGHCELVYVGLGPKLRGKGLGARLLRHGARALASRSCREIVCAVDTRNAPARRIYETHGFTPFSSRRAFVRPL